MNDNKIVNSKEFLGKEVEVKIDRPINSNHPKHGFLYELNYGYISDTISGDGEELDAYVIGENNPIESFKGICVAVVHRTNDNDDKLIVVSNDNLNISDEEIRMATNFQEKFFESEIIRAA